MDESNKLPLKRVELSLTKFNEVAIPHHLDLLRQHRTNILKYEQAGELARVRTEQTHARRVAAQLRALLGELDELRRQVRAPDRPHFDRLTQRSRDLTLRAVMDYLDSCPVSIPSAGANDEPPASGSALSTDSVGVLVPAHIQLQVDEQELRLREREAVLRGWGELQAELRALHDAWQTVQAAALAQREQVQVASASVERGADDVRAAQLDLARSERFQVGAWGAGGALAGALVGGPLGLLLGAKAGAVALLAGSALGYVGARLVGRKRREQLDASTGDADEDKKEV